MAAAIDNIHVRVAVAADVTTAVWKAMKFDAILHAL
jgi:hypothetical protein